MNEMDNILKVLDVTKCKKDSHISIYVFEKTNEEIKEIKKQLPKEFYVEMDMLEEEDKWISLKADNFAGFEYVEITVYPKGATLVGRQTD